MKPKIMNSKFSGTCGHCGERYEIDDRICWLGPGKGAEHYACNKREALALAAKEEEERRARKTRHLVRYEKNQPIKKNSVFEPVPRRELSLLEEIAALSEAKFRR